jgi:hypothetical protein
VTHENVEGSNNEVGQAGNKVEQLCVAWWALSYMW